MLRRDFTKTNKDYFNKNKKVLIAVAVFLIVGMLMFAIFGLTGNFEITGCNEFTATVTEQKAGELSKYQSDIASIVNSCDAEFDNVRIYSEGDNTQLVIRYTQNVTESKQFEMRKLVSEKLNIDISEVSEHVSISPVVNETDYIYTIASILILMVLASVFCFARYNGASALAIILSNIIGTMAMLSFASILRLVVGISFLAILVILNLLIDYFAINLFETMHKSSWYFQTISFRV